MAFKLETKEDEQLYLNNLYEAIERDGNNIKKLVQLLMPIILDIGHDAEVQTRLGNLGRQLRITLPNGRRVAFGFADDQKHNWRFFAHEHSLYHHNVVHLDHKDTLGSLETLLDFINAEDQYKLHGIYRAS